MSKKYNKWERFYNQLNMIFHGVVALSMIPFAWAFLETQRQFPDPPVFEGMPLLTVKIVGIALSVLIMLFSYQYSRRLLNEKSPTQPIDRKLKTYLSARKKDYILLELACIVAFIGLYLTKDQMFTMIYVAALVMFSTKRPSYNKITKALGLSDEEVSDWINEENKRDDQ